MWTESELNLCLIPREIKSTLISWVGRTSEGELGSKVRKYTVPIPSSSRYLFKGPKGSAGRHAGDSMEAYTYEYPDSRQLWYSIRRVTNSTMACVELHITSHGMNENEDWLAEELQKSSQGEREKHSSQ